MVVVDLLITVQEFTHVLPRGSGIAFSSRRDIQTLTLLLSLSPHPLLRVGNDVRR